VLIDILYCGVCHSDIHQARDEWGGSIFPMVPGHEIIGKVVEVGTHVKKWKRATLSVSAVSSIPTAPVPPAAPARSSFAKGDDAHL
jgi:D-arabinose 1-dehydrogenase-like Zn-dependent alcohol dehydrogenase